MRTFASFDLVSSTSSSFSVLACFFPPFLCFVLSEDLYYYIHTFVCSIAAVAAAAPTQEEY